LNRKEQRRLVVLNQVETGKMTGREADEILGLSLRHVRRLLAAYRKEGFFRGAFVFSAQRSLA